MSRATWDVRWSLHAPATASGTGSSSDYASWKRRVQALLEVESVWEVVSESIVFDEAWPLAKQLEFVQKDKLGMHLILSTVHDSVITLLGSGASACDRSWLMLQRLDRVFAAHRMQTSQGDELARLRGSNGSDAAGNSRSHDDELMYQLLDALPPSWASFVALECETDGALTWTTTKRKVLAEYARRCALRALGSPTVSRMSSGAAAGAPTASSGASSSSTSGVVLLDVEPTPLEQRQVGDTAASIPEGERASRLPGAKMVVDVSNEVDLRSPMDDDDEDEEEEDDETFGLVDEPQHQQQQEQGHETSYYDHQHVARPQYSTQPLTRHRRDIAALSRPTPYARPTMTASGEKICFYCSTPGHLAHLCPLKRMHWEARKKKASSSGYRHHHHLSTPSQQQQQ